MLLRHGFTARSLARSWTRSYTAAAAPAVKKPRGQPRKAEKNEGDVAPVMLGWEDSVQASLNKELAIAKRQSKPKQPKEKKEKKEKKEDEDEKGEEVKPRKKRAEKAATATPKIWTTAKRATKKDTKATSAKKSKKSSSPPTLPPRLSALTSTHAHHDLPSFLAHATQTSLSQTSTVYRGTYYEYTVQSALANFNIHVQRIGRSNDLGIDLVGTWTLPSGRQFQVLVQCKAAVARPSMVRELEGAYAGAPSGWRGEGVLAFLVIDRAATKGVREALRRSRWPMGVLVVEREGEVKGLLWNTVAEEKGLAGLGVTVKYADAGQDMEVENGEVNGDGEDSKQSNVKGSIGLTWMGQPWTNKEAN